MRQVKVDHPDLKVSWIRNIRIPMRDGITLAADAIMPDEPTMLARNWKKLPAVLEYMPYRKNEAVSGARFSEELVRNGYIVVRVDLRGTGDSEGISTDEYLPVEQQDGFDTVEWIARQNWCDGQVSIIGLSYGGFTALQIASLQPPHLKTIIPIDFTDNRYSDDCHYCGGLLRMYYDVAFYGNMMVAYNAMPPSPEWLDNDWERIWLEHLEGNEPYIVEWLTHQLDGIYWQNGSVGYEPQKIKVPVFMFGGWRDGYPNPPLRLYQHLGSPRKVIVGPWNHSWPDKAIPGPRIDFIHEVSRWLDYWCKDIKNGIMEEPPVQVFMQEYQPPLPDRMISAGEWRAEISYPPPHREEKTLYFAENDTLIADKLCGDGKRTGCYYPQVGIAGGLWSGGIMFGLPSDQRSDEAFSLQFETTSLDEDFPILGMPVVDLYTSTSASVMGYVVKLSDVAPDGTSTLVTKGARNITRKDSFSQVSPASAGEIVRLNIPLDCTGYVIKKGDKIRLSICFADFPNLWPTPELGINDIYFGKDHPSCLVLPMVPRSSGVEPVKYLPSQRKILHHLDSITPPVWATTIDQLSGMVSSRIWFSNEIEPMDDVRIQHESEGIYRVDPANPENVSAHGRYQSVTTRREWVVKAISNLEIHSTATDFYIEINLEVYFNEYCKHRRQWQKKISRSLL